MNLDQTVGEAAARFSDRAAYVSPTGWAMTYSELDSIAGEVAAGLVARGLGEGSVIAAILPPRPEYVVLQVAAARIGAAIAGINHKLADDERASLVRLCRPDALFTDADTDGDGDSDSDGDSDGDAAGADIAAGTAGNPDLLLHAAPAAGAGDEAFEGLRVAGGTGRAPAYDPERPLAIVFTSGTTGTPRGAVYAQRQVDFITAVDTGGTWGDPGSPPAHGMSGMSLTHLGPTTKLQGNLMRGGTTHLLTHWSPATALELIEAYRMPAIAGVPTQVALMLRHGDFGRRDLSCVRAVVMGGGPAAPSLVREVREQLGVPVMVRYSCTEAGIGVGTTAADDPMDAECSVGRPHDGVSLTIRDRSGAVLPRGETGEVCLASPAVMSGYWEDPAATQASMWPDGGVHTGDLGHVDEAGRLCLSGRAGDMYVRGGHNVHPGEVESVLSGCPGAAEIAVVPRPDEVMGEIGVAVVVPGEGADPPDLETVRDFGEGRLARHKLPEAIVVLDEMPLTAMEKLDRTALRRVVTEAGM